MAIKKCIGILGFVGILIVSVWAALGWFPDSAAAQSAQIQVEKNKDIAVRFCQVWGKGDRVSLIDEFASPEITVYYPVFPRVIKGIEALKAYFTKRLPSLFGDTDMQVEEVIAEGEKVVLRYNWSGIHRGEWPPGTPATGKRLKFTGILIYHIVDGKVVDERGEEDYLAPFRELGLLPKPPTQ